jgi:hypothetical protein
VILKKVSFPEAWKKFSDIFKCNRTKTPLSWLERLTSRFITKVFRIFLKSTEQVCK